MRRKCCINNLAHTIIVRKLLCRYFAADSLHASSNFVLFSVGDVFWVPDAAWFACCML